MTRPFVTRVGRGPALAALAALGLALAAVPGATPARAADESKTPVVGTVVYPDGTPAEGVELWLIDSIIPSSRVVVLGQGRSEAGGRFRLVRREVQGVGSLGGRLKLWAYRPGSGPGLAVLRSSQDAAEPGGPVRLELRPVAEAAVRVLDPEGQPVAGAMVAIEYFHDNVHEGRGDLPDDLATRLGSTTGADGRATLKAAPEEIAMVRVTTGTYGVQVFHMFRGLAKPIADLRLRPVSRVEGRVAAADPAAVRGVVVYLSAVPDSLSQGSVSGRAEALTDGEGRFTVPALAPGRLSVDLPRPAGSLDRALNPGNTILDGTPRVDVVIPLKRLVRVRGEVREKGAGTPVADVFVRFSSPDVADPNTIPSTRSDARGRFEALALPGENSNLYVNPPKAYVRTMTGTTQPVGEEDGQTLPPIEVERGATLAGRVVDEAGKPVPGVTVQGTWLAPGPPQPQQGATQTMFLRFRGTADATTDAGGHFLLEGIQSGSSVSMEVTGGDARTERPQLGTPGAVEPVTLRVSKANVVALAGRVVDAGGRPIAGASVRIRSRAAERNGLSGSGVVRFDGREVLRTGPDGRFRTPRSLRRGYAYRALVRADGRLSDSTPWLLLGPATDPTLPDLALVGLRTVRGRVVDDRGRPVAGAVVRVTGDAPMPVRATADANGRFALADVVEAPGFVFVEKRGFRFQGRMFGAGDEDVEVAVVPEEGPPPEPRTTRPPALTRAEELALLHRVLDPYAEKALENGPHGPGSEALLILARAEPARVLERIDREGFGDASTRDRLRSAVALGLLRDDPAAALVQIAAIRDPSARAYTAYAAAGESAPVEQVFRRDLLDRALAGARAIGDPTDRAIRLAQIGERYLELGEPGRASEVAIEAQAVARQLAEIGRDAHARGTAAEGLAPLNLAAAMDLIHGTRADRERDAHLGRIAQALAGRDPAGSERVLMMMRDVWPTFRDEYTQRVCHGMVRVDPARARRLAAAMTHDQMQARAYGVMALALSAIDRPAAVRLLAEAYGVLERAVEGGKDEWNGLGTASTAAAGLLSIVEAVDPSLVRESIWRTMALRPPLRGVDERDGVADLSNVRVAAVLCRYDREAARVVLDAFAAPAVARLGMMPANERSFHVQSVFTAAAAVDPARAVAMVEAMPDEPDATPRALKDVARLVVARVLSFDGLERWRDLESNFLHAWRTDFVRD